jgi:hypothetical protein
VPCPAHAQQNHVGRKSPAIETGHGGNPWRSADDLTNSDKRLVCDGDARAAIRALLVVNSYLEAEVERLEKAVSLGYGCGRVRRPRGLIGTPRR